MNQVSDSVDDIRSILNDRKIENIFAQKMVAASVGPQQTSIVSTLCSMVYALCEYIGIGDEDTMRSEYERT